MTALLQLYDGGRSAGEMRRFKAVRDGFPHSAGRP